MFRNLRINIFIYYFLTTIVFLAILYYFVVIIEIDNLFLFSLVLICLVAFAGVVMSKLSVDPLVKHVKNLQNLSKETLHELNLPISTIKTNMEMLRKNLDNEKDLKRASRINTACDMLQQRYNELDYMIKLQSSNIIKEKVQLDELLKQRVNFLKSLYPHIEFKIQLISTQINSDKVGLSKVIDNLIDNAVKYSQNSKNINITLENNQLHIQDYGCGMDEIEIVHIFDNYYQSNSETEGFGIGLSMVKRFCDNNAILLSLESKPNVGTKIILKFKEI